MHGPNGAGKTNLLEALYFGCTGRSCRTSNEREVVRFDAPAARVEVDRARRRRRAHALARRLPARRAQAPARSTARRSSGSIDVPARPLVSVFLPDRLELVKGAAGAAPRAPRPGRRRAVAGAGGDAARLRAGARAAQRAAGARPRRPRVARRAAAPGTPSWPATASRCATTAPRRSTCSPRASPRSPPSSGWAATPSCATGRASRAADAAELAAELAERAASDLERGFTGHGPHRDDLALLRDGRELRAYGSQGEQRLALLALLLAEREVLADERGAPPLMLLDDVMSELDADRRGAAGRSCSPTAGQSVITTTDLAHVPGRRRGRGVARLAGRRRRACSQEAVAA